MNNEKIISKIKKASTFGMIALPIYLLVPVFFMLLAVCKGFMDGFDSYGNGTSLETAAESEPLFGDFGMAAGGILGIGLFLS